MKYLLVLLVVIIAIGVWRNRRRVERAQRPPRRETRLQPPQDMVACAHCGLHLPRSEALVLQGPQPRYYCCAQHRAQGPA